MVRIFLHFFIIFSFTVGFLFSDDDIEVTIFHFNDVHGVVEENNSSIGFSKLSSYIQDYKMREDSYVLVIDAGDSFHGTDIANSTQGDVLLDIYNEIGVSAMTIGSNDFNYGLDTLDDISRRANFQLLASNIYDTQTQQPIFSTSYIEQFENIRIGIVGVTTPETLTTMDSGVNIIDAYDATKEEVKYLRGQGVDFIVVISHLGISESTARENKSTFLANIRGVDLVIDGNSHTLLYDGAHMRLQRDGRSENFGNLQVVSDSDDTGLVIDGRFHELLDDGGLEARNTTIVQTGQNLEYVGKVEITFDKDDKSHDIDIKILDKSDFFRIPDDNRVLQIIDQYQSGGQPRVNNEEIAQLDSRSEKNI